MKRIRKPSIIQPSGRKLILLLLFMLLLLLWLGWQVFDFGRVQGGFESERVAEQNRKYLQQIGELEQQAAVAREEIARYQREAQVEREAGRGLQLELVQMRREADELKNEVALLRSLISSKRGSLYIKRFEIYPAETTGKYRYQLIVAQALDNAGTTKAKLSLSILGKLDGKKKRVEMKEFSADAVSSLALEFKHYQEVNGYFDIQDQDGFQPETVEVEIKSKDKKQGSFNKLFPWKVIKSEGMGREQADVGA